MLIHIPEVCQQDIFDYLDICLNYTSPIYLINHYSRQFIKKYYYSQCSICNYQMVRGCLRHNKRDYLDAENILLLISDTSSTNNIHFYSKRAC